MKKSILFLLILFLAFLQVVFNTANLVLLLVLLAVSFLPARFSLGIAFWAGLCLDLFAGRPLGLTGIGLLTVVFLFALYSRRFDPQHPLFFGGYLFITANLWNYFYGHYWDWLSALVLVPIALLLMALTRRLAVKL